MVDLLEKAKFIDVNVNEKKRYQNRLENITINDYRIWGCGSLKYSIKNNK
jgi:hypothetical protein